MAKKIALWISTLYHPVAKSLTIPKSPSSVTTKVEEWIEKDDDKSQYTSIFPWTWSEQEAETLVSTSPDITRHHPRKESIGGGVIIRETLIKDLE